MPGTIHTAAAEVEEAGGKALPLVCDIRDDQAVADAVEQGAKEFGGIDIVVNNASAIALLKTDDITMSRFDLMHQVNARGTFLVSKTCLPWLRKAGNPHILMLSPPLDMLEKCFAPHVEGIAVNALWPRTTIATAAVNMLGGDELMMHSRKPDIMADAAHVILTKPSREFTGNFCVDDAILEDEGITDLSSYAVNPDMPLAPDFFVEPKKT